MSFSKKAKWMKKQLYKELCKERNRANKKKYLEGQAESMSKNMTKPELQFQAMMKELGIKCELQKIISDVIYDFYLPDFNVLVEIDGDYYHGNPQVYQEGELNRMQLKNKKRDIYKDNLAKGFGYGLERVWEKDLKENREVIVEIFKKYQDNGTKA